MSKKWYGLGYDPTFYAGDLVERELIKEKQKAIGLVEEVKAVSNVYHYKIDWFGKQPYWRWEFYNSDFSSENELWSKVS